MADVELGIYKIGKGKFSMAYMDSLDNITLIGESGKIRDVKKGTDLLVKKIEEGKYGASIIKINGMEKHNDSYHLNMNFSE